MVRLLFFMFFLCACRSDPAASRGFRVIRVCNAVWDENGLNKPVTFLDNQFLIAIVGELDEDMPLVVGEIIVAVDYAHGVVQRDAVFKPDTAAWQTSKPPAVLKPYPKTRWDLKGLSRSQSKGKW